MKHTYTLLLLFILLTLSACFDDGENYSPVLRGTISGQIHAFNEFDEPESAKGVTVTITGEMLHMQTTTDADGSYKIDNVPHTNLNITVQKAGFKNTHRKGFNFFTEKETIDIRMSRAPSFHVQQAAFYLHNKEELRANVTLSAPVPAKKPFTLATFLGKAADVSDTKYLVKSVNGFTSDGQASITVFPSISVEALKNRHGFKAGDVAYLKVYAGAAQIYGYWEGETYIWGPGLNTTVAHTYTITIP